MSDEQDEQDEFDKHVAFLKDELDQRIFNMLVNGLIPDPYALCEALDLLSKEYQDDLDNDAAFEAITEKFDE